MSETAPIGLYPSCPALLGGEGEDAYDREVSRYALGDCMAANRSDLLAGLYRAHWGGLRNFILKLVRNGEDADDLAQEVFLRVSALSSLTNIEHPRAFLHRVALNLVSDRWRSEQVRAEHAANELAAGPGENVDALDPERIAMASETVRILESAVRSLPPKCRRVLVLRKLHQLSYEEIAAQTGLSERAIEKHIMRGMARIEKHMERAFRAVGERDRRRRLRDVSE